MRVFRRKIRVGMRLVEAPEHRLVRHHLVDEAGIAVRQLVGVVTALAGSLAHLLVTEVGQVGVVHLHVAAAGVGQALQLLPVSLGDIVVESRIKLG